MRKKGDMGDDHIRTFYVVGGKPRPRIQKVCLRVVTQLVIELELESASPDSYPRGRKGTRACNDCLFCAVLRGTCCFVKMSI